MTTLEVLKCEVEGCGLPVDSAVAHTGLCPKHLAEWDKRMDAKDTARYEAEDEQLARENEESGVEDEQD